MKLALFVNRFPVRSQTFVIRQALDLLAAGVDVTVFALGEGDDWSEFAPEISASLSGRVKILGHLRGPIQLRPERLAPMVRAIVASLTIGRSDLARRLPRLCMSEIGGEFDCILAHFGPSGVDAMILRDAGVISGPIATVFHGYDMSHLDVLARHRRGYQMLFSKTEMLLPISDLWRQRLTDWGANADRIQVHHMGADLPAQTPAFDRPVGTPLRLVSVGRLTAKKGHADAIRAVEAAQAAVTLDIVGSGKLEADLRALAATCGDGKVRLLGAKRHDEVLQLIAEADAFILPSVAAADGDMEGIPVALMEAMSRGAITIATRHSGTGELIQNGVSGFLADEHSTEQLALIIDRIASGEVAVSSIREAAWNKVASEFDNARLAPELLGALKELAKLR